VPMSDHLLLATSIERLEREYRTPRAVGNSDHPEFIALV
jgi:hypothetical protein